MKSKRARETVAVLAEDANTMEEPPAKKRKSDSDGPNEVKQKKIKKDKTKEKKAKENRRDKKEKRKNLQDLPEEELEPELGGTSEKENEQTVAVGAEGETNKNGKKEQRNSKVANGDGKLDKISPDEISPDEISPDDARAETVAKKEKKSKREKSEAKNEN
ncbi:hypothetical protein CDD82_5054 [Ophiocordyceps australis]|uniref:Uncharacterized protein n=1 Tax=Ophiocordyceps australis TaxID=1399860 RepID=A0A2C5YXA0_9HYPO|nr:hypothetical protein CDD82_5054 [Ophiocordyceps australis]